MASRLSFQTGMPMCAKALEVREAGQDVGTICADVENYSSRRVGFFKDAHGRISNQVRSSWSQRWCAVARTVMFRGVACRAGGIGWKV